MAPVRVVMAGPFCHFGGRTLRNPRRPARGRMAAAMPDRGLARRWALPACTAFGVAFGVIEGAVVVYLRALCSPDWSAFPPKELRPSLLGMELVREAATIVLLLSAAWLAERRPLRRFAVFAYCFAVWDLAYYATLRIALGWPAGLLDWDILFLIPIPWLGPVLAPILVSICLIVAAVLVLREPDDARAFSLRAVDWVIEIVAGLVVIGSFLVDTRELARGETPRSYPWVVFGAGLALGAGWFARAWLRHRRAVEGLP